MTIGPLKKIEHSPFDPLIKRTFPNLLPYIPQWMTANMISLIGLAGAAGAWVCLALTARSRWFCIAAAAGVFIHWFADTLDGEVARARRTSNLGYYLDHFGDSLAVAFIGTGAFLVPGAHLEIGLVIVALYLLLIIQGLIRTELTRTMELPRFGPTEVHLGIFVILIMQVFIDFGRPWSWFPALTGNEGWLTLALNMRPGLTFTDTIGILVVVAAGVMLVVESIRTALIARDSDRTSR